MKLEFKHIAPYLPYGLRCEILNYKCDYVGEKYGTINGYYFAFDEPHYTFKDRNTAGKDKALIKPILRQLSDLTKDEEFEQFCKEQITCANLMVTNSGILIKVEVLGGVDELIAIGNDIASECPYLFYSWLIEHHYDISGLIKEGLAIDINTIES